jgi:hypothetical protein
LSPGSPILVKLTDQHDVLQTTWCQLRHDLGELGKDVNLLAADTILVCREKDLRAELSEALEDGRNAELWWRRAPNSSQRGCCQDHDDGLYA